MRDPLLIERLHITPFEGVAEVRLLRDHDLVRRHDLHRLFRRHHREVIQEPAMIFLHDPARTQRMRVRIHGLHDRSVTDSVESQLPAKLSAGSTVSTFPPVRTRSAGSCRAQEVSMQTALIVATTYPHRPSRVMHTPQLSHPALVDIVAELRPSVTPRS
jgi:hypothetical protein